MATTRIDIDADPTEVYAVLADGWTYGDWVVGAKQIRAVDDGFPAVGTRLHHTIGAGPATIGDVTEVVAAQPPRFLELRAAAGPLGEATITFDLEATPAGTCVTMHERPIGDAAPARVGRRVDRLLRVRNAEALWRLKRRVEMAAPVNAGTAAAARLPEPLVDNVVRLFALIAAVRGERSLHPRGQTLSGTATLHPAGRALAATEGDTDLAVVARLSRGAGLPHPLPDFNGVAVRFVDAHGPGRAQDLLLAAAPAAPILRHVIRPAMAFTSSGYSSVLPYRAGDRLVVFRCAPLAVRRLDRVASALPVVLELQVASLLGGWQPAATLTLDTQLPDDRSVRFDPWNTGDGLQPTGFLNGLRRPAYAASRAAAP